MKTIIYNILKTFLAAVLAVSFVSCDAWLNVKPQNEQPMDEFWQSKEEVLTILMGSYVQTRACLNLMVRWGEVRGDVVELGPGLSSDRDMLAVKSLSIQPDNSICTWQPFYNVIGRCNSVLTYAPKVLETDDTFSRDVCDQYMAEAVWLRTLAYFYLVRSFKDVPYVLEPYVDDNRPFEMAKTDGKVILQAIAGDLLEHIGSLPVSYGLGTWENKGRATVWAAYALLADIYLWLEDYDACIDMCSRIEKSEYFYLLPRNQWYRLYYPGNSDESIFELQWDAAREQTNNLFGWFYNDSDNNSYAISDVAVAKFNEYEDENDVRANGGSYIQASSKIWKYAGTATGVNNIRESTVRDANWIIYRYSEILLMHAEALVFKDDFEGSYELVKTVRERAGYATHPSLPQNVNEAIDLVLDERLRELCFEGKRWFDLVRTATRQDGLYKDKLINLLLMNVPAKDRPLHQARLQNTDGYYFPINETDIDASGGLLVQNSYYL